MNSSHQKVHYFKRLGCAILIPIKVTGKYMRRAIPLSLLSSHDEVQVTLWRKENEAVFCRCCFCLQHRIYSFTRIQSGYKLVEWNSGREPGRTWSGRGTGDGRRETRKGWKPYLNDSGKRKSNSNGKAFVIFYCLWSTQKHEATNIFRHYIQENENSSFGYFRWNWKPFVVG